MAITLVVTFAGSSPPKSDEVAIPSLAAGTET